MPKEVYGWNKPEFKNKLTSTAIKEVFIAPETCPSTNLSVSRVKFRKPQKESGQRRFNTHPGMEEAFYVVKGRMRLVTPNDSVVLEEGGFGWVPAGMPHRGEALENEVIFLTVFGPARAGNASRGRVALY